MLLGHSKAAVDVAAALSHYWCDLKDKVAGLALVQSPYGGTPIASDIMRESEIADKETRRIMELIVCRIIKILGSILKLFLDGAIDGAKYEDECRTVLGTWSFPVFTLDKLIDKLTKFLLAIATDEESQHFCSWTRCLRRFVILLAYMIKYCDIAHTGGSRTIKCKNGSKKAEAKKKKKPKIP
ncbi:unnamed protein product [Lactuca virosa]|uniref:Sin3 C-terminal domain-containing protein n=1 Tax=Lactuca virosa TaxID=75947 RepID=A0AAU9P1D4_9ASTR|nr:unnamed protein product [Lactuca virosa]